MRSLSRHLAGLLVATASLSAQFPATSATNAPIANASGDQAVPKLAVTADGGSWIAWFDGSVGGYAVRIQRLDRNGYEQFPHNGLLVSSNPQSTSLVDWDLITDSSGNAVLTLPTRVREAISTSTPTASRLRDSSFGEPTASPCRTTRITKRIPSSLK